MIDNLLSININSKNRKFGESDNFAYDIDIPNNIDQYITHVWISQITIPKSFYTLSEEYNEFHLIENNEIILIWIPIGNYWLPQLYYAIWILMTTASHNNISYILTNAEQLYDTGKIKFIAQNNINNIDIQLSFTDFNDIYEL